MNTAAIHRQTRRSISAHFAGQIAPAAETAMRAHIEDCAACRGHYERQWLFAQLDPRAIPAEERIAAGLGLGSRAGKQRSSAWVAAAALSVAAALAVLVIRPSLQRDVDAADSGIAARGSDSASGAQRFWVYRIVSGSAPKLAEQTIRNTDELAFAYANPAGKPYVIIFGVDERRNVYWFHPGWAPGAPAPKAVHTASGPGPHELSEAIAHAYAGHHLDVYAVFCEQPLDVLTVEAKLRDAPNADLSSIAPGAVIVRRAFEVSQ